eukprot:CAMPEP_0185580450 /NCGR_PEP_ID=MMETSP0434-20130131/16558_1 /TAXON_ID=626734 ORGANISM="Favella taraikaensis, Strain Fe Narragansett Bay" /NCGR_SAMPLE_ID=MMETSP0434 /ASSEMBLY_ACC=CAM_ASM_000379 /LENGTH=108 /DNA_ID=CAMNT_0028198719 /DNA_START=1025 /DNA_END=1351 /DNA_ORIENTATION=-
MASEVVHHVSLCAETLSAVLGAREGSVVVVHAHVHGQVVSIVEGLPAGGHRAYKVGPQLVVCQMSLQVASGAKLFLARLEGALEDLPCVLLLVLSALAAEALSRARKA